MAATSANKRSRLYFYVPEIHGKIPIRLYNKNVTKTTQTVSLSFLRFHTTYILKITQSQLL